MKKLFLGELANYLIDEAMEDNSTMVGNSSIELDLPIDMQFNDGHVVSIVTYSVLMIISAIGNSTVLYIISRRRRTSKTRINTMLMHLAIADLLVIKIKLIKINYKTLSNK